MPLKLLPYNRYSKSAKALADALGCKRIVSPDYRQRYEFPSPPYRQRSPILNWGCSSPTQKLRALVINRPEAVAKAANKLTTLSLLKAAGIPCVEYTAERHEAAGWLRQGHRVVARTLLSSHSGNGIVLVEPRETLDLCLEALPQAPLYTKYFRADAEYRVHVFNGQVIDAVQKRRRNGYDTDPRFDNCVRVHSRGWVFTRDGLNLPGDASSAAIRAVAALGLHFGAVDVRFRLPDRVAVLEVNTAPGLEGTTLVAYTRAVRNYLTRVVEN